MHFDYNEDEGITEVYTATSDDCVMCRYFDFCPLIDAIENNLVYPAANILNIEGCLMYAPYVEDANPN